MYKKRNSYKKLRFRGEIIENYRINNYYLKMNRRDNALREFIPKKSSIHNTLITTYGIDKNEYSSIFQNVITLDDLF